MMKECKSCGAPSEQESLGASWKCGFCKSVNYDENYVEAYFAKIDVAKLSSYMRLAKASYEAGNFEDAVAKFDKALTENAENAEAWAYKGLALAHAINLGNIDKIPSEVDQCFLQANSLTTDGDDFVEAAHAVARERVVSELVRSAVREVEQAQKSAFAFSHDSGEAREHAGGRYGNAFRALGVCLAMPSSNVRQMVDVCRLTVATSQEPFAPSAPTVRQAALDYLEEVRVRFPSLQIDIPQPVKAKSACFPSGARIATGCRSWTSIRDLHVGQTVLAYDPHEHRWEPVAVVRVFQHPPVRIVELLLDGGGVVATTASHSFLTAHGWCRAGQLRPDDSCLVAEPDARGEWRTVRHLRLTHREEPVYSFITSRHHITCVDGAIVHEFTRLRSLRMCLHALVIDPLWAAVHAVPCVATRENRGQTTVLSEKKHAWRLLPR